MARIYYDGLDDRIKQFDNMAKGLTQVAEKSLRAAAKEYEKGRQTEAERRGFRDSGSMIKNIKVGRKKNPYSDVGKMTVYSRGKDEKGVRNAEKEFLLHYGVKRGGRKNSITASHWIDAAEAKAQRAADNAMEKVWDEATNY